MNLEEELRTLETQSNVIPTNNIENNLNGTNQIIQNAMPNLGEPISIDTNTLNTQSVESTLPVNQPAMVNVNQATQQTAQFNYANLEFDINKPLGFDKNPLDRLTGDKGATFRIHLLPNVCPSQVHVHWDAEKKFNIVCLKDVYGTQGEPCCTSHGQAKLRVVIPVIVYPIASGNPNMLVPGQKAELKALVLGYKQFYELQNQANLAGVVLTQGDIFATVDNPTYKSFNFTVRADSLINNVTNINELLTSWKEVGTPENICKACGRVITREEYQSGYSSYDYKNVKEPVQTPTQGQVPQSFTFNTPMNTAYPNYGQGIPQGQPFYNANQPSQNNFTNIANPWQ